jgi:hypothetical protein
VLRILFLLNCFPKETEQNGERKMKKKIEKWNKKERKSIHQLRKELMIKTTVVGWK